MHVFTEPTTTYSENSSGVLGIHRSFFRIALRSTRLNIPVEPGVLCMVQADRKRVGHAVVAPPIEIGWPESQSSMSIQTRSMTMADKDLSLSFTDGAWEDKQVSSACEGSQMRLKDCQVLVPKLDIAILSKGVPESTAKAVTSESSVTKEAEPEASKQGM